ncbi:MAG: hypothetical protein ABI675_08180 [Chitinophagaceae bacterium]
MKKMAGFFLFFPVLYAEGQSAVQINSSPSMAVDSAVNLYFAARDKELEIYNGRVFYGYPGIDGHAFYPSKDWQKGSILYDGTLYHDVFMQYDVYKDQVIIRHPNTIPIYVFSERVQKFYFGGQVFIRLRPDKNNVLKEGFYQILTEGKVTIVVMRQKKLEEKIVDLTVERKFLSSNLYYALKDGNYYPISKQKFLLNLLKDKRQNILKHLKKEKLKYKQDAERTIVTIAEFYNQS